MGELFSIVVFIVIVISSIAKKIQEQRAEAEARKERAETRGQRRETMNTGEPGADLPPETRRMLYGEPVRRQARPRQAEPAESTGPRPLSGEELLETLLGMGARPAKPVEEEEGEWRPVHQPRQRRELQGQPVNAPREQKNVMREKQHQMREESHQMREQKNVLREQTRSQSATPAQQRTRTRPVPVARVEERSDSERQLEEQRRLADRKRRQAEAIRQRTAAAHASAAPPAAGPMFGTIDDVRRGIVMMELLGPCRALREYQPPSESQ